LAIILSETRAEPELVVPDFGDPPWPCSGLRSGATRQIFYPPARLICKRYHASATIFTGLHMTTLGFTWLVLLLQLVE